MGAQPQTTVSETLLVIFTFYPHSASFTKRNGDDRDVRGTVKRTDHQDLPEMSEITPNGFLVPSGTSENTGRNKARTPAQGHGCISSTVLLPRHGN